MFTAKKSGHYLLNLKVGGHFVRGFPAPVQIVTGEADPANTILAGVRSSTLVLTAGEEETVAIDPRVKFFFLLFLQKMKRKLNVRNFSSSVQDAFGNTVSKERLSEYAGRFSLRLSGKMGSKDEEEDCLLYTSPSPRD